MFLSKQCGTPTASSPSQLVLFTGVWCCAESQTFLGALWLNFSIIDACLYISLDINVSFFVSIVQSIHLYLSISLSIFIYIYADQSNNGTQISEKQVNKQRDARTLNNGTRLVSRYKNSGFALFWVYAISDAGSSVWVIDDAEPWKLVGLVFRIFGPPGNRMSSFWGFVSFSLHFFDENTTKTGVSENVLPRTCFPSNLLFMDCANSSLIGCELRPFICAENARN